MVFTTLLAFAETILLVRFLGATVLGLFILVRVYPEMVQQILDCRTRETIIRYLGEFVALNQRDRAASVVRLVWMVDAAAGMLAMAVVFPTIPLAARFIAHDPSVAVPMALYVVAQFAGTVDSASGPVLRVFGRFKTASAMGAVKHTVRFAAVVAVLLLGGEIVPLIYTMVVIEVAYLLVSTCISLSVLRKSIGFRVRGTVQAINDRRREIIKFLVQTNVASTLKMTSEKLVMVVVGALGGPAVAAYYKVATQVGSSIMLLSDPLYVVVYPSLSKMAARKEWSSMFAGLSRLGRIATAVALPAAAIATGLMFVLVPAIFGSDFSKAVLPAIIVLWGVIPDVIYFWAGAVLACLDQVGRLVRYRAIASAIQLAIAASTIPFIGTIGAATSFLAMHWIYTGLRLRLALSCRNRLLAEKAVA